MKRGHRCSALFGQFSINLLITALLLLSSVIFASAQDEDCSGFNPRCATFDVGVGFTPLVGDIGTRLDNGWHVRFGAGYDFGSHFSASLEYTYHGLGVSEGVLTEARVPDGSAHLWSLTVDPKLRLKAHGKYVPYLVGGVGFYRRTVEFTQPALVPVLFIDPFFGTVFNTLVPANQVLGDIRRSGIGGSLGAGFDRKLLDSHVKFFAEARYHYAATGRIPVRMIPLTVGLRW